MQDPLLTALREQVSGIILGAVFLFVGSAVCALAAVRGRRGGRMLVWFGVFNAMYGIRLLAQMPAAFAIFPRAVWSSRSYCIVIITYLINIPALLFWLELSLGVLRRFLKIAILAASVIAIAGVFSAFFSYSPYRFLPYHQLLVIFILLVMACVNTVPHLSIRLMSNPSRVSAIGTLVLAAAALHANLRDFLKLPDLPFLEPLAFIVFVLSLGYVAAQKIFTDERRLLSIENELAIAREIQSSTLPAGVPELGALQVSASYLPMTAVAGDFYDFIPVDQNRTGFLVADVSGHGVPAALIAAMIKVAVQSVVSCANDPCEVLRRLNQILSGQLRGQYVTAAYLWVDTEAHRALYSAAGHPPLLRWRKGTLDSIESNGLLFGVMPGGDYPVRELTLKPGDRFLLYTDGVVEPENALGESFGDHKLEQVLRNNQSCSPSELSVCLLAEMRAWHSASTTLQDDITLLIIDVA